jgi:hypothetical protein
MTGLTAFLAARLDEDEALARQAAQVAGPDWTWKTEVPEGCDYPTDYIKTPDGTPLLDTMGGIEGDAPHVARHDPARVLREVWAKRKIIEVYEAAAASDDSATDRSIGMATLRMVLRSYATVWNDHPDYRQEWAL